MTKKHIYTRVMSLSHMNVLEEYAYSVTVLWLVWHNLLIYWVFTVPSCFMHKIPTGATPKTIM